MDTGRLHNSQKELQVGDLLIGYHNCIGYVLHINKDKQLVTCKWIGRNKNYPDIYEWTDHYDPTQSERFFRINAYAHIPVKVTT